MNSPFAGMRWWIVLAVAAATIAAYGPALTAGFVSDDLFYLGENYLLRHPANVWKLLNVPADGVMGEMREGFLGHRNLRDLSYAFDYWLWGWRSLGFHATNVALHLVAGWLLFLFARRWLSVPAAGLGVCLFLLHPINTEAVAYVSGRKEPLLAIFVLLSLMAVYASRRPGRAALFPLAVVAFVCAFFIKEAAVVLPVLLVACDAPALLAGEERFDARRAAEWSLLALVAAGLLAWRAGSIASADAVGVAGLGPVLLAAFYPLRCLWPFGLQFEYRGGFPEAWQWLASSPAAQWLVLLAMAGGVVVLLRRYGFLVAAPVGWFFLALAPVLHLVSFHTPAAEHYLYVPGMGLWLLAGCGVERLWAQERIWGRVAVVTLVAGLASLTFLRAGDYESDYVLFADAYAKSSQNGNALYGMVLGGIRSGEVGPATGIPAFEDYVRRVPQAASFRYTLAHLYEVAGRRGAARVQYREAIRLGRRPWEVWVALARLEIEAGNREQAAALLERLLEQYPYHPEAWILLGALSLDSDPQGALAHFERAAAIDIHSERARRGADLALLVSGRSQGDAPPHTEVIESAFTELTGRLAVAGTLEILSAD